MQNTRNTIYFNFSYFALKLLGRGLYSNPWTAIAELVANGLDARASKVNILIDMANKSSSTIEIFDNGYGMSYDDLAEKYVHIGKNKRDDDFIDEETKKMLMGRKGIGKLAALYLSNRFYLLSKTETEQSAWYLDMEMAKESDTPHLDSIAQNEINIISKKQWSSNKTGTMIKLINVDLTNIGNQTIEGLKSRLADFYSLDSLKSSIEVSIRVSANDTIEFYPIVKSIAFKNFYAFYDNTGNFAKNLSDRVYIKSSVPEIDKIKREVIKLDEYEFKETVGKKRFLKENSILTEKELEYKMSGWIGIHSSIVKEDAIKNDGEYLKNKAYRPNQLRLYVRNKLAVENFLDYVKNTQAFSNYIEGEISFDILDNDELGDIATSNRQGFTEDDERVQLLISILKPIIAALITARSKIGTQIRKDETAYNEAKEKAAREAKEKAEQEKVEAETRAIEVSKELSLANFVIGSEKKRSNFLFNSLSSEQIDFQNRMHMVKINNGTIKSVISKLIMKKDRGILNENEIWKSLMKISYCSERIKADLAYGASAKFNTKDEKIEEDLFAFMREYCENILVLPENVQVEIENRNNCKYIRKFSPQEIVVLLENITDNSVKHDAKNIFMHMYKDDKNYCIDVWDNGIGANESVKKYPETVFEFGKGYTKTGSGIGLYHVKSIVDEMNGKINLDCTKEFKLQMRF